MEHYENNAKRKVHSTKFLHKISKPTTTKKNLNEQISAAYLKGLEQKEVTTSKHSRWQEIVKMSPNYVSTIVGWNLWKWPNNVWFDLGSLHT